MSRILKGIKPFLFIFILVLILAAGYYHLEYNWQWYRVKGFLFSFENGGFTKGLLLDGLLITLNISAISLVFSLLLGFLSAFARLSSYPSLRALSWGYVELIRNTPLLIQIFVIYFVISPVFNLSAFVSAVIALSLFEGAYSSEIIRSGIINIPKGQYEAAQSIGLSTFQTYIKIIIPQMLRQTLPMLAGQSVSLIKDLLPGTFVFTDIERLNSLQLRVVEHFCNQLTAADESVIIVNHPRSVLGVVAQIQVIIRRYFLIYALMVHHSLLLGPLHSIPQDHLP